MNPIKGVGLAGMFLLALISCARQNEESSSLIVAGPELCNPGGPVSYYPTGELKSCVLRDFHNAAGIRCNKYGPVGFYRSGKLQRCVTADFLRKNGVPCNKLGPVGVYESERLESCVLSDYFRIGGVECNKYGPISLYEDGKLQSCVPRPTAAQGMLETESLLARTAIRSQITTGLLALDAVGSIETNSIFVAS